MIGSECCPPCPTVSVNVPGAPGTDGTPGAAAVNAFTLTTANITIPAVNANVVVSVANSTWTAISENLFISDGTHFGNFQVVTIPTSLSLNLKFLGYTNDSAPAAVITTGAIVTPGGVIGPSISTPVSIANGGTGSATKAAAQTALGLGQDAVISSATGLTQVITNSAAQVGSIDITIPALGSWLYLAHVSIDWVGVTFGASRAITIIIRNVTQGVTIATATRNTQSATTTNYPTIDYYLPLVLDTSAAVNDHLQIQISAANNPPNSAGTFEVIAGSLCAVPLRKS